MSVTLPTRLESELIEFISDSLNSDRDFEEGGYLENMRNSSILDEVIESKFNQAKVELIDLIESLKEDIIDEMYNQVESISMEDDNE